MGQLNLLKVQSELNRRKISIFSIRDFVRTFRVLPQTAKVFLSHHSRDGLFRRVRRGVYIYSTNPPEKFEISNFLYKPSYISFESALSFYGVIPETVYTITSATTKVSKEFVFQEQSYEYRKIKRKLFFGYQPVKIRGKVVLMADKEKALLDYLYFSSIKHRRVSERIDLNKINRGQLGKYINFFRGGIRKRSPLMALVKEIYS